MPIFPRTCALCERTRPGRCFLSRSDDDFSGYDWHLCDECRGAYSFFTIAGLRHILDECRALVAHFFPEPEEEEPTTSTPTPAPPSETLSFGTTRDGSTVTINETDRTRHVYLIGGTGSGKSVTLTNLATHDINAGHGFTTIDPHGDLAQGLLQRVPPDQFDRVVYFDPTDDDAPAFNLLASDFDANKLTSDLVATFKMFFGDSWGFQMEALLSHALLTLLLDREHEPHTFADLRTLLIDPDYRAAIVERSAPELQSFWHHEYQQMTKDAARPILTRLGLTLMPGSALRRVLTNREHALDVRAIMDQKKILLVNLSKGALGEQPARLLGGLIVTAITQAALARQSVPENQRTPHTLYCDEFQNFADLPSTESILSEARKYQLRLVLAHQTMAQVNTKLMANILGNVRTLVGFNVSPQDAHKLAERMSRPRFLHKQTHELADFESAAEAYDREQAILARRILAGLREIPNAPLAWGDPGTGVGMYGVGNKGTHYRTSAYAEFNEYVHRRTNRATVEAAEGKLYSQQAWPTAQDFQNLATCRAFIMRNVASSTCELMVPFPPPVPYPDNLDRWHRKRALEIAAARAEEKRPPQMPQDERTTTATGQPTNPNATALPDAPQPPPDDDFDDLLT